MMKHNYINKIWIYFLSILVIILIVLNIRIKKVFVDGNKIYSQNTIEKYIFENNLDRISIVCFVKNIVLPKKKIPFVEKWTMDWQSPWTVRLQIYENPIIGYIEYNQNYVYFDKYGIVVEASKTNKRKVPRVEGLSTKNVTIGKKLLFENEEIFSSLLNITQNINKQSLEVEKIKINELNNIYLYLKNIDVFIGDNKNIEIKIQTLADIFPEIKNLTGYLDISKARENMVNERYVFRKY